MEKKEKKEKKKKAFRKYKEKKAEAEKKSKGKEKKNQNRERAVRNLISLTLILTICFQVIAVVRNLQSQRAQVVPPRAWIQKPCG